jgi:hypothetical protein
MRVVASGATEMASTAFELLGLRDWHGDPRPSEIQPGGRLGPGRSWKEPWFPPRNLTGVALRSMFRAICTKPFAGR